MELLPIQEEHFAALQKALPNTEFFAALPIGAIERLVKSMQICSFKRGEYIFRQGSAPDALYIVYEGSVAVCIKRLFVLERIVVVLGPGQVFGEMALLDKQPHSASIRAVTPVKVFVMFENAFEMLCRDNPTFKDELAAISDGRKFRNQHRSIFK